MPAHDPIELVLAMPDAERRSWLRTLAPDDAADLIQQARKGGVPRNCQSGRQSSADFHLTPHDDDVSLKVLRREGELEILISE
jgi:hypothetical protein